MRNPEPGRCPLTGEAATIGGSSDIMVVEHPKLGCYRLEPAVRDALEASSRLRDRMAGWILDLQAHLGRQAGSLGRARQVLRTSPGAGDGRPNLGGRWTTDQRRRRRPPVEEAEARVELQQQPHRGQHADLPRNGVAARLRSHVRRPSDARLRGDEGARRGHRPCPQAGRGRERVVGGRDKAAQRHPPQGAVLGAGRLPSVRVQRSSSRRSSSTVMSWCRATLFRMLDSVFALIGVCSGITS